LIQFGLLVESTLALTIATTDKISQLIEARKGRETKEGFVHCLLLLALTDDQQVSRAIKLSEFFGSHGLDNLENDHGQ
jgi:hypothetical protein